MLVHGSNYLLVSLLTVTSRNNVVRYVVTGNLPTTETAVFTATGRGVLYYLYRGRSSGTGNILSRIYVDGYPIDNTEWISGQGGFYGYQVMGLYRFTSSLEVRARSTDGASSMAFTIGLMLFSTNLGVRARVSKRDEENNEVVEEWYNEFGDVEHVVQYLVVSEQAAKRMGIPVPIISVERPIRIRPRWSENGDRVPTS